MLSNNAIRNIIGIVDEGCGAVLSNPVPNDTSNCMFWVFYGLPIVKPNTVLISAINGVGILIVSSYLIIFFYFSPKKMRADKGVKHIGGGVGVHDDGCYFGFCYYYWLSFVGTAVFGSAFLGASSYCV
ncbi:hypothetical protein IEQ34_004097 [Dendrobium chrysotoxum]|uniref:Uncharacterized protein n=1 Tax=Dendrobium chrysotoxum TaxID=161865 RepID=A0AAV7GZA4_DENCH|nr:hypothetical protein IEQ34_004097 [Dendrobium chrysotoxum]